MEENRATNWILGLYVFCWLTAWLVFECLIGKRCFILKSYIHLRFSLPVWNCERIREAAAFLRDIGAKDSYFVANNLDYLKAFGILYIRA
jgi:hypothetical protein